MCFFNFVNKFYYKTMKGFDTNAAKSDFNINIEKRGEF